MIQIYHPLGSEKPPYPIGGLLDPAFSNPGGLLLKLLCLAGHSFKSQAELTSALGISTSSFWRHIKVLEELGCVSRSGSLISILPRTEKSTQKVTVRKETLKQKKAVPEEEPAKTIAKEVDAMPRQAATMTSDARFEAMTKAWNQHKPDCYNLFGSKSEPVKIAVHAHMKRLGIPQNDYDNFFSAVLAGCAADDWWGKRDGIKPSSVFGFGQELADKKYERVESLYRSGRAILSRPKPFSWSDEEAVRSWYIRGREAQEKKTGKNMKNRYFAYETMPIQRIVADRYIADAIEFYCQRNEDEQKAIDEYGGDDAFSAMARDKLLKAGYDFKELKEWTFSIRLYYKDQTDCEPYIWGEQNTFMETAPGQTSN